jgi:hypothetical protein
MWKYICLLFVVLISCVSSSSPVVATWWVNANGYSGELIITNVDTYAIFYFLFFIYLLIFYNNLFFISAGDLTGTFFGNTIKGFFSADTNKITFVRVTAASIVADWQTFVGKRRKEGGRREKI